MGRIRSLLVCYVTQQGQKRRKEKGNIYDAILRRSIRHILVRLLHSSNAFSLSFKQINPPTFPLQRNSHANQQ